jgi:hypothetical protein
MLAAGVPARTIMEVPGRSEIGVTMNTCTHVLAQLREDAADAIDRVPGSEIRPLAAELATVGGPSLEGCSCQANLQGPGPGSPRPSL